MAAERFDKVMTDPRPFIHFQIKLFCSTKREQYPYMYDILKIFLEFFVVEIIESFSKTKQGRYYDITDLQLKYIKYTFSVQKKF